MNTPRSKSSSSQAGVATRSQKINPARQPRGPPDSHQRGFTRKAPTTMTIPPELPTDHKIPIHFVTGRQDHPGLPTANPTVCQDSLGVYAHWLTDAPPSSLNQQYELTIPNDRMHNLNTARKFIVEQCFPRVDRANWKRFPGEQVNLAYWPPSVWLVQRARTGRQENRTQIVREKELWDAVGKFRAKEGYWQDFALVLRFML